MAAELPRPGVEVVQVFRSVSPTVITPTLVPSVVGVCKQIIDVLEDDGAGGQALNGDALITLPAFFLAMDATGDPAVYGGLDGLTLDVSINNGPDISIGFSDSGAGLTPATVVSQVLAAFEAAGVTAATAEVVGGGWRMRTIGVGEFQSIEIKGTSDAAVLSAFGIGAGKVYRGLTAYNQLAVSVPAANMPDPRGNLAELSLETSTIRVFLATGNGTDLFEAKRDEAYLRSGEVHDAAAITGSVDLTTLTLPGDVQGDTLIVSVNGGANQTVTFTAGASSVANLLAEINANTTGLLATVNGSDRLVLTNDSLGDTSTITAVGGTALATLGFTAAQTDDGESIEVVDDGDGNIISPLIKFANENFTAAATAATATASAPANLPSDGDTLILSDGGQSQTIVFDNVAAFADILSQINAVVGAAAGGKITASDAGASTLLLTHDDDGTDSVIYVLGGTALADLDPGGTPTLVVGAYRGVATPPSVGDELWVDGSFVGIINQVAPGAAADTLKVNKQLTLSSNFGRHFYIIAKNLPGTGSRPAPNLVVANDGSVTVKHGLLRDTTGTAALTSRATMYISYRAVRKDVSASAEVPGLLRFNDTVELESTLSPISADNPLALGLFFALLNAPGVQVTGLGVNAVSADAPFGTVAAFTSAAEYLEAHEVYAVAPLTNDQTVGQIFSTHVSAMSEPSAKGERIVLFNPEMPTHKLDKLVASGTDGNSGSPSATVFDTGVANLAALVQNAGISPVGTIVASSGLYLDIASDSKRYSIQSISGSQVTIRTSFATNENDDGYYSETDLNDPPLGSSLVQEAFSIKVRGAPLSSRQDTAETLQALGQTFQNRRFWMVVPDSCAATVDGLEQVLPGFYMCAAIAGMIGQQPPQQSFTNFPMTGFTRVFGSNDTYTEKQLNVMAAGGAYIVVQDAQGAPLISRMALTTDMTSIETRTDSITKVVDFTAKFLRRMIKGFIGRFNITQGFLDSLGSVIQGGLTFLTENGVLIGATLNNIIQDEDAPDTVLVDVTLDVPFPCNYVRLTLVV